MIIIEYKEIYLLRILAYIYITCSFVLLRQAISTMSTCSFVLLRQAMSIMSIAVIFRSYRALMAVYVLVCRVVAVVPILPPLLAGSPLTDFLPYNYAQSSNRKPYCPGYVYQ